MEDENGIELSLGLSCGGSSSKSKIKDISSDYRAGEGSINKTMGENMNVSDASFKHIFQTSVKNQDQQNNGTILWQQENFWSDLGKCHATVADDSNDVHGIAQVTRYQGLWASNKKTPDTEEVNSGMNKRKLPFEEINLHTKHERVDDYVDTHGKSSIGVASVKSSDVSVTREDGPSGENEDVTESKECSSSWLISQNENRAKCSETPKLTDKCFLTDLSGVASQGQKQQCVSDSERPMVQTMNTSNLQLPFGYSSDQLPTLETNLSWAFGSQPQQSSFPKMGHADGLLNSERSEDDVKISHVHVPLISSEAVAQWGKPSDLVKGGGKHVEEACTLSASQTEGYNIIFRPKETANQPVPEGFPREGSIIRSGLSATLEFGGCGSYPDLPWVTTTEPGSNGKTISGVTYEYSENQIKIVCACHGSHMSPKEFVQHASANAPNQKTTQVWHDASAQSKPQSLL